MFVSGDLHPCDHAKSEFGTGSFERLLLLGLTGGYRSNMHARMPQVSCSQ